MAGMGIFLKTARRKPLKTNLHDDIKNYSDRLTIGRGFECMM